jgi:hypothetical protein
MRDSVAVMRPDLLCGLLAEPDRLAAFSAVVLGASTPSEVVAASGLGARDAVRALRRLEQGGLVSTDGGRLVAQVSAFKEAVREAVPEQRGAPHEPLDPDRVRAGVLRTFVRDGRLVRVLAAHTKRRIVLEHIVACFEPGVRYPERAVDAVLRAWHPDYATLRRCLVDEDLISRENGVYWRTGGFVDVGSGHVGSGDAG